jgi:hypothetical protein
MGADLSQETAPQRVPERSIRPIAVCIGITSVAFLPCWRVEVHNQAAGPPLQNDPDRRYRDLPTTSRESWAKFIIFKRDGQFVQRLLTAAEERAVDEAVAEARAVRGLAFWMEFVSFFLMLTPILWVCSMYLAFRSSPWSHRLLALISPVISAFWVWLVSSRNHIGGLD